jgi:hypothetical protein
VGVRQIGKVHARTQGNQTSFEDENSVVCANRQISSAMSEELMAPHFE